MVVRTLLCQRSRVSPKERISWTSSPWHPTIALRKRVRASPTRSVK